MLGYWFHKKRDEVHRVLHGRVNRAQLRDIAGKSGRATSRCHFTETVWVLPCQSPDDADFTKSFPALTADLCSEGISILHQGPISDPCVIIGLKEESDRRFLACKPEHCTPLGYNFFHIGLFAAAVIEIKPADVETMRHAVEQFGPPLAEPHWQPLETAH